MSFQRRLLAPIQDLMEGRSPLPDPEEQAAGRTELDRTLAAVHLSHLSHGGILDAAIDLKVTDADARDLLETIGEIMGAKTSIDPAIKGKISLELERSPLRSTLDVTCMALGCKWRFDAEKNLLTVKPKG